MSRPHTIFVSARLALWQRRIQETAGHLVLPQATTAHAAMMPVLDQLVAVHNLASGLVSDLRQSADGSLADGDVGRQYLSQLASALAHISRAATRLSTVVIDLAEAHRLTSRPGKTGPVESQPDISREHAAALRSLKRALQAVAPPAGTAAAVPLTAPAIEHRQVPDTGGPHSARRRP
ncbi:hypothetical protein [Streptomyces sp. NPDC048385]|uniref:hypothetical protein n=1 Tax=Streptomyces sp. NPDC048385 TaxID=3155145 RepID=UPI003431B72C